MESADADAFSAGPGETIALGAYQIAGTLRLQACSDDIASRRRRLDSYCR